MDLFDEAQRYKQEKEEFVSNHGGSTSREVIMVILPSSLSILVTATITGLIGSKLKHNRNLFPIIEFIFNIIPSILCCTILSDHILVVCATMMTISLINFYIIAHNPSNFKHKHHQTSRIPFVTNFRALTNILTAICILAVDFRIFPRKFAKTEVYGYSLMDTGVGLFIIANALVAPETREFDFSKKISHFRKFTINARNSVKSTAPLLLLGIGRMWAIEYSNYQKHITEYGVHWNFFITLAFVKIFISTVTSAISSKYSLLSGIWIIAMHEYALSTKGLKEWVLGNAPRSDFVSANREGLVSVPGYVGLYLIGIAVGRLIYANYHPTDGKIKNPNRRIGIEAKVYGKKLAIEYNKSMILCIKLSVIAPIACGATLLCDRYFGVSRRLANSGYCAWIITLSTAVLTLLLLVEIMIDILIQMTTEDNSDRSKLLRTNVNGDKSKKEKNRQVKFKEKETTKDESDDGVIKKTPELFEAVNFNGLIFFLVANLLTGIVNMRIKTLYVSSVYATCLLISYSAICIFIVFILYRFNKKIKL
ncbi:phosphatidylinositol-glycan biosynthesis class W protein [Chelonus insularis]|uniref:phosphatidylinositol-glycan biosynthesis class W protein n=1 Tax=Chelonus insularis TaxID=460826 RepID=UPI00158B8FAC|nr:phosphatidylinositol-glycan biosynthesis class W protein [Chelonus insularis]